MKDGCYRIVNRAGDAAIMQVSGGRLVELLQFTGRLEHPPKRLTRRRLGDSITEVLAEARRAAEVRRARAWEELTGGYL